MKLNITDRTGSIGLSFTSVIQIIASLRDANLLSIVCQLDKVILFLPQRNDKSAFTALPRVLPSSKIICNMSKPTTILLINIIRAGISCRKFNVSGKQLCSTTVMGMSFKKISPPQEWRSINSANGDQYSCGRK